MRFDEKASTYEASAQAQASLADWVAEWLEPSWPSDFRVLELGAGTGLLSRHLRKRAPYDVQDLSLRMLEKLSHRFPELRRSQSDAFELREGGWDRLYSTAMLQWAPRPRDVLRNWRQALARGGRMLHGLFVSPSLSELSSLAPAAEPFLWRSPREWMDAAEDAGLRVLRSESRTLEIRYANARSFLRSLHDTGTTSEKPRLAPGRLRQLLRDYDRRFALPEGGVRSTWTLLRFEASPDGGPRQARAFGS